MTFYQDSKIICSFENNSSNHDFNEIKEMVDYALDPSRIDVYECPRSVELTSNDVNNVDVSISLNVNTNQRTRYFEHPQISSVGQIDICNQTPIPGAQALLSHSDSLLENRSSEDNLNTFSREPELNAQPLIKYSLNMNTPDNQSNTPRKSGERREIFRIWNPKDLEFKKGNQKNCTFREAINILKEWYELRGKFKRTAYKKIKKILTARAAAAKMGKSKKTLDYYQLTIRKCLSLGPKIQILNYLDSTFGAFSKVVYTIYNKLNEEDGKNIKKINKSKEVKLRLEHFIWDH